MKIEPPWKDSLMNSMRTADRSGKPAFLDPLIIRLGALQRLGGPSAVFDPRPAAGLIEDLASWEERVLRNEVSDLPHDLHRAQIAEIGTAVVLPQMQEEVARNAALLQDWDVSNLPELLQRSSEMADGYCADPRFLLARPQREFMMSQLFSAFLATELVKLGWLVGYSVEKGILLHGVQREINPDIVIRGLASGKMSRDEFLSILADGPIL